MGPTPAKVGRIRSDRILDKPPILIPGPEQIHLALGVLHVSESTYQDLGSVIIDCEYKHYNRVSA